MKRGEELTIITRCFDLILWSCHHTSRFPSGRRFVLRERIERRLYVLLETLFQARYTRDRQALIGNVNLPSLQGPTTHYILKRILKSALPTKEGAKPSQFRLREQAR
jgi:hypothetical protein